MFLRQKGTQTDLGRRCDARWCKTLSLSGCWILCHLFVVRGIACSIACGLARHQAPTRHNTGLRHNWAQRNTKQYETIRDNTRQYETSPTVSLSLCPAAHDRRTTARIASAKSTTRATREKMPEASSFAKFAKRFKDYLSNGVGLTVLQSLTCFSVSTRILNWHLFVFFANVEEWYSKDSRPDHTTCGDVASAKPQAVEWPPFSKLLPEAPGDFCQGAFEVCFWRGGDQSRSRSLASSEGPSV